MIDHEFRTFLHTALAHNTQELTQYWLMFFEESEQEVQHRYYADFLSFFTECVTDDLHLHTASSQSLFNFMLRLSELIGEETFYNFKNSVYTCYLKFPIFQLMEEKNVFNFKNVAALIAFFESLTSRVMLVYIQKKNQIEQEAVKELREREAPMSIIGVGILMVSIVGTLNPQRVSVMIDRILEKIEKEHIKHVIIDINALSDIDIEVTQQLLKLSKAMGFMGTRSYLAGVTRNVAKHFTYMEINLGEIHPYASTKDALDEINRLA